MTNTHSYRGLAWIDLDSPTDDEIAGLVKRYGLHPLVGEELKSSSTLAKIDFYKDYILVVLTLPTRMRQDSGYEIADREIDFVIGKNFLITSRFDAIDSLEYFAKVLDTNTLLNKDEKIEHAGHLFYYMIKRIYAGMIEDLENIRDALISAESKVFNGEERKMVEGLSKLSRELMDFRQTVRVHREIWDDMVDYSDKESLGLPAQASKEFSAYIRDIRDQFNRIHELTGNARELLVDLRETNDSLLNAKQNEIVKALTLVAFIFYPVSFIAALFTIPSPFMQSLQNSGLWWILVVAMIGITVYMWRFFKAKRWM